MLSLSICTRQLANGEALVCAAAAASAGLEVALSVVAEGSALPSPLVAAVVREAKLTQRGVARLGFHDEVLVPALAPLIDASERGVNVGWLLTANGGIVDAADASRAGANQIRAARRALETLQAEVVRLERESSGTAADAGAAAAAAVDASDVATAATLWSVLPFFRDDAQLRPLTSYVERVGRAECWAEATAVVRAAAPEEGAEAQPYAPVASSNVRAVIRSAFAHGLAVFWRERDQPERADAVSRDGALVQRNGFHSARGGGGEVDFQCNDVGRIVAALGGGKKKKKKKKKQKQQQQQQQQQESKSSASASAPPAVLPADVARDLLRHVPRVPLIAEAVASDCGRFVNIRCDAEEVAHRIAAVSKFGAHPVVAVEDRAPRDRAAAIASIATFRAVEERDEDAATRSLRRVAIDYSSPNVAKEMHVGHLRSTLLGDVLARVIEWQGSEVERISHIGDWGGQFGMLIALRDEHAEEKQHQHRQSQSLDAEYKEAKARFVNDRAFTERAREATLALQRGDAAARATWRSICETSRDTRARLYARLGIDARMREVGESVHVARIPPLLEELEGNGMLVLDQGARVVHPGGEAQENTPPLMVQKSDGGWGYDSTDLASLRHRLVDLGFDQVLYVVDAGQALHFRGLFEAARTAGWTRAAARSGGDSGAEAVLRHVRFGLVSNADGKRMRSSGGETVSLSMLLDSARDEVERNLAEQEANGAAAAPELLFGADNDASTAVAALSPALSAAEQLAYDSVRYAELRQARNANYTFELDRVLAADGDTNVYLQYTHARIRSILRRADDLAAAKGKGEGEGEACAISAIHTAASASELVASSVVQLTHPAELALATELLRYGEVVALTEESLAPHHLCELVHSVAARASTFLAQCHVLPKDAALDDATVASRLVLIDATAVTMRRVMCLLGITPLERL